MNSATTRLKAATPLSLIFFILMVAATGFVAAHCPLTDDDVVFENVWGCVRHTICPEEHFDPIGYALEHWELVNGRFGDMFTPIFTFLPMWLFGIVYSLAYAAIILLSMKIARLSFRQTPVKAIWFVGATVLFYPWQDVLFTRAVFFNYFPAVIFTLVSMIFFLSPRRLRGWRLAACIVCGLFAGCWHELMPVVLFPSALVYCIATRSLSRNQIVVIASMSAGLIIVMSAPSFFNRVEQLDRLFISDNKRVMARMYCVLQVVMGVAALLMIYLRRGVPRADKALVWALVLPVIPSCAIMLASLFELRMCFLSMIMVMSAFFLSLPAKRPGRIMRIAVGVLTAAGMLAVSFHMGYLCGNSVKVKRASDHILHQLAANPDAHPYYDLTPIIGDQHVMLYKGMGRIYINRIHSWDWLSDYTGSLFSFNVLHPALRDFDLAKADTLDARKGVYRYKGCILIDMPCDTTKYIKGNAIIGFENGDKKEYQYMSTFFTDVNGKELLYIIPYNPTLPDSEPVEFEITLRDICDRIADMSVYK